MKVLVIGASRGIGLEFVRQYRAEAHAVTATARDEAGLTRLRALGAAAIGLDVADEVNCAGMAWPIDGAAFDVAVFCAGIYGPRSQALETPTQTEFDAVMHTNVLGAMRVFPQLADAFAPGARLAVISSRMGSIGSRSASSGWLYRASKAALNSVLKDTSLVLGGRAVCVAFHPGWVKTDMGGAGAALEVEASVADMRATLARLGAADNGRFLNHDGSAIEW
jgi:NAD(P)-dependent dehydrogenase (short-subunit alcohol dehydrogenase family)